MLGVSSLLRSSFTPISPASPANAVRPTSRRDISKIRTFAMERGDHYFLPTKKAASTVGTSLVRRKGQKKLQYPPLEIDLKTPGDQSTMPFDVNVTIFDAQCKIIDATTIQKRTILGGAVSLSRPTEESDALRLAVLLHQFAAPTHFVFVTVGIIPGASLDFYGEPLCVEYHAFRPTGTQELVNGRCGPVTNSAVAFALMRWRPENCWALICMHEAMSGKSRKHQTTELTALAKKLAMGWRPTEEFRSEGQVPFSLTAGVDRDRATPDADCVNSCDTQSSSSSDDGALFGTTKRPRVVREGEMRYNTGRTIARSSRVANHFDNFSSEDEEDQLDDVAGCLPLYSSPNVVRYDSRCYNVGSRREAIMGHFAHNQAQYRRKAEEAHVADADVPREQLFVEEDGIGGPERSESTAEITKEDVTNRLLGEAPMLLVSRSCDGGLDEPLTSEVLSSDPKIEPHHEDEGHIDEAQTLLTGFEDEAKRLSAFPGAPFLPKSVSAGTLASSTDLALIAQQYHRSSRDTRRTSVESVSVKEREGQPSPHRRSSGSRRNSSAQGSSDTQNQWSKESASSREPTVSSRPRVSIVHDGVMYHPSQDGQLQPPVAPAIPGKVPSMLKAPQKPPRRPEAFNPLACLQRFSELQYWLNKIVGGNITQLPGLGKRPPVPRQQHSPHKPSTNRSSTISNVRSPKS